MGERPIRYYAFFLVLLLLVGGVYVFQSGLVYELTPGPNNYEQVTVTAYDANGTELAAVTARVADTDQKRYIGLSDTESLGTNEGMLFVHGGESRRSFVMRDMDFPLDMVFVGSDERINTIHHAPVPEGDWEKTYSGRAKWILEVPRGWANRTGVDVGDRIAVPESARNPD
jgi:uncharacterized membrane protein (UPF0127 family)